MYILDTDHVSLLERRGQDAGPLLVRLSCIDPNEIATTIISYEEQTRGWMSYMAKARTLNDQVRAYQKLEEHLANYCYIPVVSFDQSASFEFDILRKSYPRLGTMDLKIAAIVLSNKALLLTRNLSDFGQIRGLRAEDWTI